MVQNYARGYRLEWKTKKMLEKKGWIAMRSPASSTEADVIAMKEDFKLLIQCKKTTGDSLYVYGLRGLRNLAKEHNAKPLLVYGFGYTAPFVMEVTEDKHKIRRSGENTLFAEYLKKSRQLIE